MKHLSQGDLVDWLDGQLAPARAAHLDECVRCREEAQELRQVLTEAEQVSVADPSPLFWDHLSARVNEVVTAVPERRAGGWARWVGGRASMLTAAAACLVVGLVLLRGSGSFVPRQDAVEPPPLASTSTAPEPTPPVPADDAWALVQMVADDVPLREAQEAGLTPQPGSAERMALELSPREQEELALLLRHELKGSGL
jgi:hypothetical protein